MSDFASVLEKYGKKYGINTNVGTLSDPNYKVGSGRFAEVVSQYNDKYNFLGNVQRNRMRYDSAPVIDAGYINQYLRDHSDYWSRYGSGESHDSNINHRLDERRTAIDEWLSSSLADGTIDQQYYDEVSRALNDADSYIGLYQGQREFGNYINDWNDWYNSHANTLAGMDWSTGRSGSDVLVDGVTGFAERNRAAREWLNTYRAQLGDEYYNSAMDYLNGFAGATDSLRTAYDRNAEYYNMWDSQEAYDISQMSADELQAQIDNIGVVEEDLAIVNDLLASNMPYSREYAEQDGRDMAVYDMVEQNREYIANKYGLTFTDDYGSNHDQLAALVKQLEEEGSAVAYTTQDGQNVTWQQLLDSRAASEDLAARLAEYSQNDDWEELSQSIQQQPHTDSDYTIIYSLAQSSVPYDWETAEAYGYTWEEFDAEEQRRRYIESKYGVDLHSGGAEANMALRNLLLETDPGVSREKDTFNDFEYMTDEERQVLSYIYNTQGREAALAWHEGREWIYENEAIKAITQEGQQFGYEHPVRGTLWHIGANIGAGAEQVLNMANYLKTGELHQNRTAARASALTAGTMEKLDWEIVNWDAFDFLYSTAVSGFDSYVNGKVFGPAAEVMLGLSAAASATNEALERGMNDEQAFWTGITAGTFEAVFEHLSIGNLRAMKEVFSASGKQIALNIAKSMLVNATEETATEAANIAYDLIVNGDFSQYETTVRKYEGLGPEEAKRKAAVELGLQIFESGASGALMGMGFGVSEQIGPLVGNALDAAQFRQLPKDVRNSVKRLQGLGMERGPAINASIALYRGADAYGENAAAYIAAFDPKQDAYTYAADFRKAYEIGKNNGNKDYLGKLSLNEAQQRIAYELGVAESRKASREAKAPEVKEEERTYSVSDDGATIDSSGKKVTVKGFSSVGSKVTLKLEGGKTIDAKEVSFGTADEAILYETIGQVAGAASTANHILESYKTAAKEGMSASDFAAGLRQAYDLGVSGQVAERQLGTYELAGKLPVAARSAAFSRGKTVGQYKATSRQAALEARGRQVKGKREGTFHFDRKGRTFDSKRESSLKAMEALSKALGIDIYVYESYKEGGKRVYQDRGGKVKKAPNGYYDAQGIHIDLNAGNFGQGTMMFTVAHELTHFIKEWSPVKFRKLADLLVERYAEQGTSVRDLIDRQIVKAKENGRTIDRDTAFEEVVADSMETMLTQGDIGRFMAELKPQDRSLWEKVRDWFKDLAQKLQAVVEQYKGAKPETAEGQLVAQMEDFIQVLQQAYAEALVEAGENYRASEGNKKTTQEGGVKFQTRNVNGKQIVWIEENILKQNKGLPEHQFIADYIAGHIGDIYTIIESGQKVYIGDDLPGEFTQSKYTQSILKYRSNIIRAKNRSAGNFGEMIEIATNRRWEKAKHPENKDAKYGMYRYDTMFGFPVRDSNGNEIGANIYKAELVIRNASDGKKYLYDIVSIKKDATASGWLTNKVASAAAIAAGQKGNVSSKRLPQQKPGVNTESIEKQSARMDVEQEKAVSEIGLDVDAKTESVAPDVLYSERTWTESEYVQEREKAALAISKAIGVTEEKAKQYIDDINSIAKMIAEDRTRLDYFSSPNRSSFVGNVEYGGSFDFSTLCKKRRLLTGTFTAIQKALPNTALTANEILDIRNRMKEAKLEVSCGLCYVEGSRANMGQFAKEFLRLYKQYYPDAWQPNMADVNTPEGIEWVRINHPECYEQYEYFWNHYGTLKEGDKNLFASQQKPKLYQLHTEYKGEILDKFNEDNVEDKNLNGGIRLQSFSDFEIVHLIDTMQIIMDMSRVGLNGQAYTKVPDFAWALGDTGLKINLSLIAKGVDENGKLIFDDVEGMPISEAMRLRERYSENVGTILVAFNDQQLMAAMADDRVDFIIPFHRSQWKKSQYEAMGLPAKTKDYTYMQNEKFIKPQYHEYRGRMVKDKATNFMPNEYWDFGKSGKENAVAYLELCARNNKRPKFYKLLTDNKDGSYSLKADGSTDGYWKLLIDFKMYDNQGNGSPQRAVKPDFNMNEANRMLNDYKGGHSSFPVAQGIVDQFVAEYKDSHKGKMFSDRDAGAENVVKELEKQKKALNADAESLAELIRLRGDIDRKESTVYSAARYLSAYHGVIGSKKDTALNKELAKLLKKFYSYLDTEKDLSWEQIEEKAKPVTEWIFDHTKAGRQRSEYARDVLAEIRSKHIRLTEAERAQAAEGYDSYEEFRKKAMGSVTLANQGTSLEKALEEWSRLYPGTFDAVLEAENKPQALMDVIRGLRTADSSTVEYGYIRNMTRLELARSVYDSYWRADAAQGVRTKNEKAIEELRRGHRAQMTTLQKEQERVENKFRKERSSALEQIRREYRTEVMQAVEDTKSKYIQQREKATENRKKSDIRNKIRAFKKRMEDRLLHPTDNKYIPEQLARAIIEVCELIDTDTELYKKDGTINKAQERRNLAKEKLGDLKDAYEKLSKDGELGFVGEYDQQIDAYLGELKEKYSGKQLSDMTTADLNEFYSILSSIEGTLRDAKKLIGWADARTVYEAGDAILAEQSDITKSRRNGNRNAAQTARDRSLFKTLSPMRNVERMSAYHQDSYLLGIFRKLEDGVRRKNKFVMDAYKSFEGLTSGKEYDRALYDEYGSKKYTDVNGREFGVSKMQMMQCILSLERETANGMKHIEKGGFTFADLKLLRKGNVKEAISEEHAHRVANAKALAAEFREALKGDKWCQDYMEASRKFFNETAKNAINETMLALKHRIIARDKNYIPFEVDKNFVSREVSAENDIQQTINSYGMLKDITKSAPQPLIVTGLNNVIDRHIDRVGNVYGLAVPVRNFNKVWNAKSNTGERADPTVKAAIQRNWGNEGVKHIEQAVQDVQGPRIKNQSELYQKIKSGYIGATFALNLSVVGKQIGSMYSASSMLRWRDPVRMTANLLHTMVMHKKIAAEVDKYTATAWMRRQGMSDEELYTLLTQAKKPGLLRLADKLPAIFNPAKWITAMDHAVALSLWKYAKQDTKKRTGLKGEALLVETAKFYDDVIESTQSMSDMLHRPEIQKSGNWESEIFGTFKTDLYQMAGQLQNAAGRFFTERSKENAQALTRTVYGVTRSILWTNLITILFAMFRYKMNPYRDEEDKDITLESFMKRIGFQLAGEFMGYLFPMFGGEALDIAEAIAYGEKPDAFDVIALSAVNDLVDVLSTVAGNIKDGEMPTPEDLKKVTVKALQLLGVPANNIIRTIDALKLHAEDIANGNFLSFEAGANRTATNHVYRIVDELDNGNTETAKAYFDQAVEEIALDKAKGGEYGSDEVKEAKSQLKSTLGNLYKDGLVTRSIAEDMLRSYWELSDEDIYWTFDKWDYAIENGSSDGYQKNGKVYAAALAGEDISGIIEELVEHGKEEKEVLSELKSEIGVWYTDEDSDIRISRDQADKMLQRYIGLNAEEAEAQLRDWDFEVENGYGLDDIRQTYLDEEITAEEARAVLMGRKGDTQEEADRKIAEWDFEKTYDFPYSDRRQGYADGKISSSDLMREMMEISGYTKEQANDHLRAYDWLKENPEYNLSVDEAIAYTKTVDGLGRSIYDTGIQPDVFLDYRGKAAKCKGTDDDGDGKVDSGSKKKQVLDVINGLPISDAQKDALYYLNGWAKSKLWQAPWH